MHRNTRLLTALGIGAISLGTIAEPAPFVVIDAHNDTVQTLLDDDAAFDRKSPDRELDLPRLRAGGVTVPFFAANVPVYYSEAEAVRRTLDFRDVMQRVFDKYPGQIELATTARQIEKIVGGEKLRPYLLWREGIR